LLCILSFLSDFTIVIFVWIFPGNFCCKCRENIQKRNNFFVSTEIQDALAPSPPGAPGVGAPGGGAPGVGAPGGGAPAGGAPGGGGPPPTSSDDWDGPPGGRANDYEASLPGAPPRKGRIGKAPPAIGAPLAATPGASGGAPLAAVPGAKEETPVSQCWNF
jgi:hypothetical protein